MPRFALALICLSALALAACAEFPDLANRVAPADASAQFPALVPTEPLLAAAAETGVTPETGAELEARAAALRARAARLRRGIIDAPTRARMRSGVTEPPV